MVALVNPHTGKPVEAEGALVERLESLGFKREKPEPVKRKPGRPKKSE